MAAQEDDEAGAPFDLDAPAGPEPLSPAERLFRLRLAGALAVVLTLLAGAVIAIAVPSGATAPTAVDIPRTTGPATPPTTSLRSPTPARITAPAPTTQATPTVPPDQLAAETAELQRTAARLRSLRLSSPASWDKWLPEGKPYPGANTADDISTCPKMSDRLTRALGMKMSYWIGTLPGQGGCDWAPVPLTDDDAARYPYVFTVAYVADGTTIASRRRSFVEHGGARCPDVDASAAAPGAALVRCVNTGPSYSLLLPDTRRRDGVWILTAEARANANHPASFALTALLDATRAAFG